MKGFIPSKKNFSFPTSADASFSPTRKSLVAKPQQQIIRPHFRSKPQPPKVGHSKMPSKGTPAKTVGDQGNATVQRAMPVTEFEKTSGGKSPLRSGYAKGGSVCAPMGKVADKAIAKHVATPAPKGHKGAPSPKK